MKTYFFQSLSNPGTYIAILRPMEMSLGLPRFFENNSNRGFLFRSSLFHTKRVKPEKNIILVLQFVLSFTVSSLGFIVLQSLQYGLYRLLHIKLRSVLSWQPMVGPLRCSGSLGPEGRLGINQNTSTCLQELQANLESFFSIQL